MYIGVERTSGAAYWLALASDAAVGAAVGAVAASAAEAGEVEGSGVSAGAVLAVEAQAVDGNDETERKRQGAEARRTG